MRLDNVLQSGSANHRLDLHRDLSETGSRESQKTNLGAFGLELWANHKECNKHVAFFVNR